MIFNNVDNKYRKAILTCSICCVISFTMPNMAMGAESTEERVLSHFEETLAPPDVVISKDAGAIEGFISNTKQNLATNAVARDEVLLDLNAWIDSHPHSDTAARALMLRADIFQQSRRKSLALLDWLSVKALFPSSRYAPTANKLALETIQASKYKQDREVLESILKSKSNNKIAYRHADLLKALSALTDTDFRDPLAHAYRVFLVNLRSHELAPMVQMLLAENRAMENIKEAVFQYETLISVYPRSLYIADALLAVADFNQTRLNNPDEAVKGYQKVIKNYPKQAAAQKAYLNMAMTYERHVRDEAKAIEALKDLVRQYPHTPEASKGGESLGRLYEKTKQYDAAVAVYRNMVNVSRDSDAIVSSLEKASFIAAGKLDNYKLMIDINNQLCRSYPDHDACAEAHYRNGSAYEKNLGDSKKAIEAYDIIVKKFPEHRLSKKAAARIKSLSGEGLNLNLF